MLIIRGKPLKRIIHITSLPFWSSRRVGSSPKHVETETPPPCLHHAHRECLHGSLDRGFIGWCVSVRSSSRIDAEGSLTRIARGIGLHTASPRLTTVRDAPGLGVSQGPTTASRSRGDPTSQTMEWWALPSLDGH